MPVGTGTDTFRYYLQDPSGLKSQEADMMISVQAVNDHPVAEQVRVVVGARTASPVNLVGRDIDADDSQLIFQVVSPPTHGSLTGEPPTLFYIPDAGFPSVSAGATDEFTYKVNDGFGDSEVAVVQIVFAPSIDPNQGGVLSVSGVYGGDVKVNIPPMPGQTVIYPAVTLVSKSDLPVGGGIPDFAIRTDIDIVFKIIIDDVNGNLITDLANNPITVSIPFDSSSSVSPDTIALVDSVGAIAFLPTSVVGNTLQAQVMHLSYILSLRNNTPIVVKFLLKFLSCIFCSFFYRIWNLFCFSLPDTN